MSETTWYICKICRRSFRVGKDLIAHKKKDHPEAYRVAKLKRKEEKKRKLETEKNDEEEEEEINTKKLKSQTFDDFSLDSSPPVRNGSSGRSSTSGSREGSICSGISSCCTTLSGSSIEKSSPAAVNKHLQVQVGINDSGGNMENTVTSTNPPLQSTSSSTTESTAESTIVICQYCRDWFPQEILLKEHILLVHGIDRTYHCLYCKKTYTTRGTRDGHENKIHPEEKKKQEENKGGGPQQTQGETQRKLYECTICGTTYVDHLKFSLHNKKHVAEENRVKTVEILKKKKKKRKTKTKITVSVPENTKLTPGMDYDYECDECHRCYQTRAQLVNHISKSGHISSTAKSLRSASSPETSSSSSTTDLESTESVQSIPRIMDPLPKKSKSVSSAFKSLPKKIKSVRKKSQSSTSKATKSVSTTTTIKSIHQSTEFYSTSVESDESDGSDLITVQIFQGSDIYVCNVCMVVHKNRQFALDHARSHSSSELSKLQSPENPILTSVHQQQQQQQSRGSLSPPPKQKRISVSRAEEAQACPFLTDKYSGGDTSKVTGHICNFCNQEFSSASTALQHVVVHTGERNYSCACGESFLYPQHLSRHKTKCILGL